MSEFKIIETFLTHPGDSAADDGVEFVTLTPCSTCKHRSKENSLECVAFPDGIPAAILDGAHQHRDPFPGDRGIKYERKQN